jgi:hypothetical protein
MFALNIEPEGGKGTAHESKPNITMTHSKHEVVPLIFQHALQNILSSSKGALHLGQILIEISLQQVYY